MSIERPLRSYAWPLVFAAACFSCQPSESERPNILLVSIDTLRADHLGCYGREQAQTPAIDALAAGGVVFDAAVSPVPITLPSHATMLTGLLPPNHGVRHNTESRLTSSRTTLPELLRASGYRTGAFVGASPMDEQGGLGQGFEVYDDVTRSGGGRPERPAKEVFDAAREWVLLASDPNTPVFAFIHVFDPHWPLENALPGDSSPSYDGEIAYVDRQLDGFLKGLPDTQRWRDALIVIVSDHGEGLGEHGETSHGLLVYEGTLRVPWIVHRPSTFGPRRVAEPVGLADLAPTLAELAGLGPLKEADGVSLVPVLHGAEPTERAQYFESLFGFIDFGWAQLRGLRVGSLKYTLAPKPELYDLSTDPAETNNLHASRPDDVERLHRRLQSVGEGMWTRIETDEERLARLSSLGYVSARPAGMPDDDGRADPKDKVETFYRLAAAVALTDTGRHAEAYAAFESLEAEFGTSPHFYTEFGDAAAGLERWEDAARSYERVLALDADNLTALENLAVAQLRMRRFNEVHANASRLLSLDPDHVNGRYLIGSVEIWTLGRLDSGVEHWRRVLESDPNHQRAAGIRSVLSAYDAGQRDLTALRQGFLGP